MLQEVTTLGESDLCNAFYAGMRKPPESERYRVDEVIAKIGRDTYNAIMARVIPENIVNIILRLKNEGHPIAVWTITQEVRAGTLQWRDDLAHIGAIHPRQVAARSMVRSRVISPYRPYLRDYAKSHDYRHPFLIMSAVQNVIVEAVERGIEAQYGRDIVLGIALVRGHVSIVELQSRDETILNHATMHSIADVAKWLSSRFISGWIMKRPTRSQQVYQNIIQRLNSDWQNMPITHPLIPT